MAANRRVGRWSFVTFGVIVLVLLCGCGTANAGADRAGTPTVATPAAPLPTPNAEGDYDVNFQQAQRIVPFPLTMPGWIPPELVYSGIHVAARQVLRPVNGTPAFVDEPPDLATLFFVPSTGSQQQYVVQLDETTRGVNSPMPINTGGETPTTLTLNGVQVTTFARPSGPPMTIYTWRLGGVRFNLAAEITGPLTKQDVEHMISSMVQR